MRIGIFGGCFNPPHKMHKDIALNLIKNNYIDKVIYVPTGNKYQKNDLIDAKIRYNMIEIMIEGYDNLEISDYEIKNNLTYTYQTLNYFKNKYKNDEIYFICGTDNLSEITTWKNYEYILSNFKLLVINRNNDLKNININILNNKNIVFVNIPFSNISSSLIRSNLDKYKKMIDKKVFQFIEKERLYL